MTIGRALGDGKSDNNNPKSKHNNNNNNNNNNNVFGHWGPVSGFKNDFEILANTRDEVITIMLLITASFHCIEGLLYSLFRRLSVDQNKINLGVNKSSHEREWHENICTLFRIFVTFCMIFFLISAGPFPLVDLIH